MGFTVVDVKRPILSVSRLMNRGIETFIQTVKQILRRFDGATVELIRRGGLFVVQCQAVVPMLLALVDEEPAGEAPDLPLQPVTSGDIMDTHLPCQPRLQRLWPSSWERKQRCVTITKPARHTRHPMRPLLPEDRGRCSNGHSPGGNRHSVQTDGCHSS